MSPKNPSLVAGLAALGVLWQAAPSVARQDAPSAPAAAPSDSPSAAEASVILLSDGKILRGKVTKDETGTVVVQKLGTIPLKKGRVEGIFASLREVYEYKRDRMAQVDPDEHLKLAHWCLKEGLKAEAKEELARVLSLVEGHPQAGAMLASIEAETHRPASVDPGVQRTSLEMPADGAPGALDPEVLGLPSKRPKKLGRPVIFDLPPAQAARLYQEFVASVHPELQRRCAGCHNERSESAFQLMQVQTRPALKDPVLLRNNLDVALRLVDRERPDKSELLTSSIMPHGKLNTPVLPGVNSPSYRAMARWVQGLKSTPSAVDPEVAPTSTAAAPRAAAPATGSFGADRGGASTEVETPAPFAAQRMTPSTAQPGTPYAPMPVVGGSSVTAAKDHPSVPADSDFRTLDPLTGTVPSAPTAIPPGEAVGVPGATKEELTPLTAKDLDRLATRPKAARKIDPSVLQKFMLKSHANP